MKIEILDSFLASKFEPKKPSLAIRIFGSRASGFDRRMYHELRTSSLWKGIFEYSFDDIDDEYGAKLRRKSLESEGYIFFNKKIARQMIRTFDENRRGCSTLMVHCYAGRGRSPAVALALSEIFSLGRIEEEFPQLNKFVYRTLIETARELKI